MRLFKHSSGIILAFGFDVYQRCANANVIAWSDFDGVTWEPGKGQADRQIMSFKVKPEFINELADQRVIAYQKGRCIEMTKIVDRWNWAIRILSPEDNA